MNQQPKFPTVAIVLVAAILAGVWMWTHRDDAPGPDPGPDPTPIVVDDLEKQTCEAVKRTARLEADSCLKLAKEIVAGPDDFEDMSAVQERLAELNEGARAEAWAEVYESMAEVEDVADAPKMLRAIANGLRRAGK